MFGLEYVWYGTRLDWNTFGIETCLKWNMLGVIYVCLEWTMFKMQHVWNETGLKRNMLGLVHFWFKTCMIWNIIGMEYVWYGTCSECNMFGTVGTENVLIATCVEWNMIGLQQGSRIRHWLGYTNQESLGSKMTHQLLWNIFKYSNLPHF